MIDRRGAHLSLSLYLSLLFVAFVGSVIRGVSDIARVCAAVA